MVWPGEVRRGKARQGEVGSGAARQGKAWQGFFNINIIKFKKTFYGKVWLGEVGYGVAG